MNIKRDRKMLSDIGRTGDLMKRTASLGLSFLMLFEILLSGLAPLSVHAAEEISETEKKGTTYYRICEN